MAPVTFNISDDTVAALLSAKIESGPAPTWSLRVTDDGTCTLLFTFGVATTTKKTQRRRRRRRRAPQSRPGAESRCRGEDRKIAAPASAPTVQETRKRQRSEETPPKSPLTTQPAANPPKLPPGPGSRQPTPSTQVVPSPKRGRQHEPVPTPVYHSESQDRLKEFFTTVEGGTGHRLIVVKPNVSYMGETRPEFCVNYCEREGFVFDPQYHNDVTSDPAYVQQIRLLRDCVAGLDFQDIEVYTPTLQFQDLLRCIEDEET